MDSYVKAALQANSSLTTDTIKTVAGMSSITENKPYRGWIEF